MNKIKMVCITTAILATTSIYAQSSSETKTTLPYGDNPNIFKVLAYKTGQAVQNTAEKVGNATEKGINKIKPKVGETWDNTKTYTTEQAEIARDTTRKGIDTAVKKVNETKDNIVGTSAGNVPIERGNLSDASMSSVPRPTTVTAPVITVTSPVITAPPIAPEQNASAQEEPEITKQSLPLNNSSSKQTTSNDDVGVPR